MRNLGVDSFRRPESFFSSILKREALGIDRDRFLRRATVIAVDLEGGLLQNKNGSGELIFKDRSGSEVRVKAIVGPPNPRGSIKARILTDGFDRLLGNDDLRVFWPLFPQDQIGTPIAPGEHVYIIFEDDDMTHGMWISRVSGHDSANAFIGSESYDEPSAPITAMDLFEENAPEYPRNDDTASLAPPASSMRFFDV